MPELDIYIAPQPGTMVVWHNVDTNGENDPLSLHGGCPVFAGNKVAIVTEHHLLAQNAWVCKKN